MLLDLLAGRAAGIHLDRAALEIARIEYPDLDPGPFLGELDRHAAAIADRVPDLSDGPRFISEANAWLFGELGLRGNQADYYNPANSCLNRVLETGLGIPITLSVVYIEIARRLAKPIHGIGLPGHFVIRYDDGFYSTFIDPFHEGKLIDIGEVDPAVLRPFDTRSIVVRMLNNLRQIYFSRQDSAKALQVLDLLLAAEPDAADTHKQRAVALIGQKRMAESLTAFKRYLDLNPAAPDRDEIREQIRNLAFWLASRN